MKFLVSAVTVRGLTTARRLAMSADIWVLENSSSSISAMYYLYTELLVLENSSSSVSAMYYLYTELLMFGNTVHLSVQCFKKKKKRKYVLYYCKK